MKPVFRFASAAVLALVAGATLAAVPASDTTREERMDQALQNYRAQGGDDSTSHMNQAGNQPGPMARAEESVKRGAHKTANAIKHGAQKTGEFVGKGVRKTGEAIHNAGEKLESKSTGSSQ